MNKKTSIGIDIGGSHITAAIIDLEGKKIVPESIVREKLDSQGDAESILKIWTRTIKHAASFVNSPVVSLGIAMPGPFDYENGICLMKNQNKYENLYGLNIRKLLANQMGINPHEIHFANDAVCFLKGELFGGSLKNYKKGIGLTLGTGLGTAFSQDDMVVDADLWNMPFKDGIAEDYISTRWFVKRYTELFDRKINGVKDLVKDAEKSSEAEILFKEFAQNLAGFMFEFIKIAKPDSIVIGGNISNASPIFLEQTKAILYKLTGYEIPVEKSTLGENAALIGAAVL